MLTLSRQLLPLYRIADRTAKAGPVDAAALERTGRSGRTLLKDGPLRVTVIVLAPGGGIPEHQTDGHLALQVLRGDLHINVEGTGYDLATGKPWDHIWLAPWLRNATEDMRVLMHAYRRERALVARPTARHSPDARGAGERGGAPVEVVTDHLGVDLGTTFTCAAVHDGGRVEIVPLGERGPSIPSVLFLREEGDLLAGDAAERQAVTAPERVAREFKRRLGDPTPMMLGGAAARAEVLTGNLLRWVFETVVRAKGGPPDTLALTHPANWGAYKLDLFAPPPVGAGLHSVTMVTEPQAAAVCPSPVVRAAERAARAVEQHEAHALVIERVERRAEELLPVVPHVEEPVVLPEHFEPARQPRALAEPMPRGTSAVSRSTNVMRSRGMPSSRVTNAP